MRYHSRFLIQVRLFSGSAFVRTEDPPQPRLFAAQALGLMACPIAKPARETALKDVTAAVRLDVRDALSMFGKLSRAVELKAMKDKDANRENEGECRLRFG